MFAFMYQRRQIEEIGHRIVGIDGSAQHPGRHLAMKHRRGDVGMVGRHLPPAKPAITSCHFDKADLGSGECLDPVDPHDNLHVLMINSGNDGLPAQPGNRRVNPYPGANGYRVGRFAPPTLH